MRTPLSAKKKGRSTTLWVAVRVPWWVRNEWLRMEAVKENRERV